MSSGWLSPEAEKAQMDAHLRRVQYQADVESMRRGPQYDAKRGQLIIPSYVFIADRTLVANAEWKRRHLRWDPDRSVWWAPVPANRAAEQVAKAARVFYQVYALQPLSKGELQASVARCAG